MTLYATYFDSGYLVRGLACIESLFAHGRQPISLLVLALDQNCAAAVSRFAQSQKVGGRISIIALEQLEAKYPALAGAKPQRSRVEYYFTLTPFLCGEALARAADGDYAVYLDADLFFYSDPQDALTPVAGAAVAIVEHRYPPRLSKLSDLYGRFNVGWVAFQRSAEAEACIERWQMQCLRWCADRSDAGRFGDQKYLDKWPDLVPSLKINNHPGVNLAPWNVARHHLTVASDGRVKVDGVDLIFFHFHHLHRLGASLYEADFRVFGPLGHVLCSAVYRPYLLALDRLEGRAIEESGWRPSDRSIRYAGGQRSWWNRMAHWPWRTCRLFLGRRVIFEHGRALRVMKGLRRD